MDFHQTNGALSSNGTHYAGFFTGYFLTVTIVATLIPGAMPVVVIAAIMTGIMLGFGIHLMLINGLHLLLNFLGGFVCGVAVAAGGIVAFAAFTNLICKALALLFASKGAIAFIHSIVGFVRPNTMPVIKILMAFLLGRTNVGWILLRVGILCFCVFRHLHLSNETLNH